MRRVQDRTARCFNRSRAIAAESEHEVERARRADIAPAVMIVRSHECRRTRAERGGPTGDGDFERPFLDHDHLFVEVAMGRVRRLAGSQLGHVQLDGKPGMRLALENGPRAVLAAGVHGEVLELVGVRG